MVPPRPAEKLGFAHLAVVICIGIQKHTRDDRIHEVVECRLCCCVDVIAQFLPIPALPEERLHRIVYAGKHGPSEALEKLVELLIIELPRLERARASQRESERGSEREAERERERE